jgi:hypothetical protein
MRSREDRIGLKSAWLRTMIPYSVSIPITFGSAMNPSLEDDGATAADTTSPTSGAEGGSGARRLRH